MHFNVFVNTQFELNIKSFQCDHGVNLKIKYFTNFATIRVFNFVFLVLTHLLKMENPKEKFAPFLILFVHFCVMLLSPRIFGFTPWIPLPIFSIFFPLSYLVILLPLTYNTINLPLIHIFGFFGAYAFLSFLPPTFINYNLDHLHVSFWDIHLHIVVTSAMISHLWLMFSITSFLMKIIFLFPKLSNVPPQNINS